MQVEELTFTTRLGKGSFGEVYLTSRKDTNILFATKKIRKELALDDSLKKYFNNEIYILKTISHPNIIKLYEMKSVLNYYYLVFEYCDGGGLSNCLENYKKKYNSPLPQNIVQALMRQIVLAIQYLHENRIIHRDLKLDNILVQFQNQKDKEEVNLLRATIKIIDFGFARILESGHLAQSVLGSPLNMDPQILAKMKKLDPNQSSFGYDEHADIWSLGTIAYELLVGVPPFFGKNNQELLDKIIIGNYIIPINLGLSRECLSFLHSQLQYDPNDRMDINALVYHDFLMKNSDWTQIDLSKLPIEGNNIIMNIKDNKRLNGLFQQNHNRLMSVNPMYDQNQNMRMQQPNNQMNSNNNHPNIIKDYFANVPNQKETCLNVNFNDYTLSQQTNFNPNFNYDPNFNQSLHPNGNNHNYNHNQNNFPLNNQINNNPNTNAMFNMNNPNTNTYLDFNPNNPANFNPNITMNTSSNTMINFNQNNQMNNQIIANSNQNIPQPNNEIIQNNTCNNYHNNSIDQPIQSDIDPQLKNLLLTVFDQMNLDEIQISPILCPILPKDQLDIWEWDI